MTETQVLVAGAGPTGLTLACELLRRGVPARVIDKAAGPATTSRALVVHSRSLELLEGIGASPELVKRGNRLHDANIYADGQRVVRASFDELDSPYPYVLGVSQVETEAVLRERLAVFGGKVEWGVELAAVAQDDKRVLASISSATGAAEMVRVPWLIGCDGAHSAVRKAVGLPFEGDAYEERFLLADVKIEWGLPLDEVHAFLHADGPTVVIAMPGGRVRVIGTVGPETPGEGPPTLDEVQLLMDKRNCAGARIHDPVWTSRFRIHHRLVPEYRRGRVFLAGDAAHIHSPLGGQGMNTGMQDAVNLGWKLALVAQGKAQPGLLDTYQAERRAVAEGVVRATDAATNVATLRNPVGRALRDRLAGLLGSLEVVQRRAARQTSGIVIDYARSPLVGEARGSVLFARLGGAPSEEARLGDWFDFSGAPGPGARALDVEVVEADDEHRHPLREVFRSRGFPLLLFDGRAATIEGYRRLEAIAREVVERHGDLVRPVVIVPGVTRPPHEALGRDVRVLLDPDGAVHHRYGAAAECLYLVRPDGYVSFRGQPARLEPLLQHLDQVLGASPA